MFWGAIKKGCKKMFEMQVGFIGQSQLGGATYHKAQKDSVMTFEVRYAHKF